VNDASVPLEVRSLAELRDRKNLPCKRVFLSCELTEVPEDILKYAPDVELLDLSNNQLHELPEWFARLRSLKVLFLSSNRFSHLPKVLRRISSLKMLGIRSNQIEEIAEDSLPPALAWLTLTDNRLTKLPDSIGTLVGLRKLLLAGNQLNNLPESLTRAKSLELIRLSANHFESFPEWLFTLPSLAWLALAGNPAVRNVGTSPLAHEQVPWERLVVGAELGRGASGITYQARLLKEAGRSEDVAVKVFSGAVSSDGDAREEIAATQASGTHRNIVTLRAAVRNHPEGKSALVLDLLPKGARPLAKPPSFDSCTRDVYDQHYSWNQIRAVIRDVCAAASHLHARGVMHGDLYAHNIVVTNDNTWLSDFGAACVYANYKALPAAFLERLDVRAVGILISELLEHVPPQERVAGYTTLRSLALTCCSPHNKERPAFSEISGILARL
jgi:hypothetical protein